MGGFEGGDESGYWDVDSIPNPVYKKKKKNSYNETTYTQTSDSIYTIRAHAKVDIFLKVTGEEGGKLSLSSRCVRVENVYDSISFVPAECENFSIEGCDNIPLKSNSIYKAYTLLSDSAAGLDIVDFFREHKVVVNKSNSHALELVGGASYAASFMRLAKEVCNLILSTEELIKIGNTISADIPFFIYNYPSANISGFGETVELFEEEELDFELSSIKGKYEKACVENTLKEQVLSENFSSLFSDWNQLDSKNILKLGLSPTILNDFYAASIEVYPELKKEYIEGSFFSENIFFKIIKKGR